MPLSRFALIFLSVRSFNTCIRAAGIGARETAAAPVETSGKAPVETAGLAPSETSHTAPGETPKTSTGVTAPRWLCGRRVSQRSQSKKPLGGAAPDLLMPLVTNNKKSPLRLKQAFVTPLRYLGGKGGV